MLENLKNNNCNLIDISNRPSSKPNHTFDFDILVPKVSFASDYTYNEMLSAAKKQRERQGMDVLPLDLYLDMLENRLEAKDFRSVFWLTVMSNMGLRHSDSVRFRRIDFIDEYDRLRESIVIQEHKTSKQRIIFINQAVKMALLMLLWNGQYDPLDYLIRSNGNRKRYALETYKDEKGKIKAIRKNGKYVYKLDEHGNKIPKPLSRIQSERMMKDVIINGLGVALKNDSRCNGDPEAVQKICTHSIRKMYGRMVFEHFLTKFNSDEAYASAAAQQFLQLDFGHSTPTMTTFYLKEFEQTKRDINMSMNIGIEVLEKYFIEERAKYLAMRDKEEF